MAADLMEETRAASERLRAGGLNPTLAAIIVGDSGPCVAYANAKGRTFANVGMGFSLKSFGGGATESDIVGEIGRLNDDPGVHGIMLELPLPGHLDGFRVASAIRPDKDVDGITPQNRGLLLLGRLSGALLPVTPLACLELFRHFGIDVTGKSVCIVGRGETVGLPLAVLLIKKSATVTVCHTRTKDLPGAIRKADIVVSATGKAGLVSPDMLSPGQIVIDTGISVLPDGRIVGDVDPGASEVVACLSPVPGGVGTLTVALLLRNLLKAISLQGHQA
jgi:methylenetetrahydrofolate dehydrogenase (NADP+)/methenyltetrahydrofolate cyclohydrolase